MKLLIATNNQGKQAEFAKIFSGITVGLVFPSDISLDKFDVEESGKTMEENALLKARAFAYESGLISVADDSGLEVMALNNEPGIHSKRFHPGTDRDRNQKILDLLANQANRSARFRSVLCLFDPNTDQATYFEGVMSGSIAEKEAGSAGFGYDPIFIPTGESRSVSELGIEFKNENSHRAQAIKKLVKYLESL